MTTPQKSQPATALRRPLRLGDEVYNAIYAQLMSQKIQPGSRISIDNLTRELAVSQTPIREALSRLEAQGLVVKTHLIGFSAASQMDKSRLDQLYELRLLLEPFAARKAAELMSGEQLDTLRKLRDEMRNDGGKAGVSYSEFARIDSQFHDLIAQASGNDLIQETLANLHTHVHLFRLFHHTQATSDANAEHDELITSFELRDGGRAEAAMRAHVERSYVRFSSYFDS